IDGVLVDENDNLNATLEDLGDNPLLYFGKSFYEPDSYFKGAYDNIQIYDRALSQLEIADLNGVTLDNLVNDVSVGVMPTGTERGLDEHSTVSNHLEEGVLTRQLNKYTYGVESNTMSPTDLTRLPVTFDQVDDALSISGDGKSF